MKYIVLISMLMLAGCGEYAPEREVEQPVQFEMNMPEGLKDCKTFRVTAKGDIGIVVLVTRCPNSTTTTHSSGKGSVTSIVAEEDVNAEEDQ